jgi:hypothetical protein
MSGRRRAAHDTLTPRHPQGRNYQRRLGSNLGPQVHACTRKFAKVRAGCHSGSHSCADRCKSGCAHARAELVRMPETNTGAATLQRVPKRESDESGSTALG